MSPQSFGDAHGAHKTSDRSVFRKRRGLEPFVTAVAERAIAAVLAAAEIHRAVLLRLVGRGRELRAFVRAVTKRLPLALPARAPVVGLPGFDGDGQRRFLGDDGLAHRDGCG